ncbi:uncharacterized protein LOC127729311 [Mytilus californianus]|uniref:uncharacterized protein LOC127729311 n=1 Tax=Mytilus californianus TaxID=6549 RepID=UPI002245AB1C|nr:uncharacterized protein LOC127729311 [Mytilus californianus]
MLSAEKDVGHIYRTSIRKKMDHVYEEIIAGSCKKMKFVRHTKDNDETKPTPCKRNKNMVFTPCMDASNCHAVGGTTTPKMPFTSTSVLNNRISLRNDDTYLCPAPSTTVKHLKAQGQLKLSASISQGVLQVNVIQGRQLSTRQKTTSITFVKVSIIPDGDSRRCSSKTSIVTDSNNPLYDQQFSFVIAEEDLKKRLHISVFDSGKASSLCEFLGGMSFGIQHLLNPQKDVMGWYHLLTEEISHHKHLKVSTVARMTPYKKGSLTDKKTADNDIITVTISRSTSGYGFTVVDSCPVKIGKVDHGSPASLAGLCPGDHVISVNGHNVSRSQSSRVAKIVKNGGQSLVIEIQRASQLSLLNQSLWQPEPTLLLDPTDMRRCSHDKGYTSESDLSDTDEGIYSWPSNNTSTPVKKDKKSESTAASEKTISTLIHQLLTAESNFIDVMHAGMQLYSRPLRHSILTPQQHSSLFQNIEKLVMISQFQVKQIQNNIPASESSSDSDSSTTSSSATETAQHIGKIYQSKIAMFCQAYDFYAKGITSANKVLSDLSTSEDFIKFVRNSTLEAGEPSISSYIYLPVQHIVRVYNILQQILVFIDDAGLSATMHTFRTCIDNMTSYPSVSQILCLASLSPISSTPAADSHTSRSSTSTGSRGYCDGQLSLPTFQEY